MKYNLVKVLLQEPVEVEVIGMVWEDVLGAIVIVQAKVSCTLLKFDKTSMTVVIQTVTLAGIGCYVQVNLRLFSLTNIIVALNKMEH